MDVPRVALALLLEDAERVSAERLEAVYELPYVREALAERVDAALSTRVLPE